MAGRGVKNLFPQKTGASRNIIRIGQEFSFELYRGEVDCGSMDWFNFTYDGGILYARTVSKAVWLKERVYFKKELWKQKLYL